MREVELFARVLDNTEFLIANTEPACTYKCMRKRARYKQSGAPCHRAFPQTLSHCNHVHNNVILAMFKERRSHLLVV